jgi:penicillin V acylase-like amidase (Ntn superfamily)
LSSPLIALLVSESRCRQQNLRQSDTFAVAFAEPAQNASEAVVLTTHILNAVDIPLGDIREKASEIDHCDYTQWVVLKDLKNRVFYFRSYNNSALKSIDMNKLDFVAGAKAHKLMPVADRKLAIDVTP